MRRAARIIIGTALTLAAIALGTAAVAWEYQRGPAVYTDGASIRQPIVGAPHRRVLWQPPRLVAGPAGSGESDRYEPEVSADGRVMLFVRGKAGGGADIYVAELSEDGWSEPRPLEGINTDADELGPELSADGERLLFYSDREGGLGGYDLWMSRREGGAWGAPISLGEGVNTGFNEYSPALTPDGSVLYFASNRPRDGEGPAEGSDAWPATVREDLAGCDYDLYAAPVDDGIVGAAELVDTLNSEHDEGTPSVSPIGDFVYFSSDRPGGSGGLDLYRSRRVGGTHFAPENLGAPVNTIFNEADAALSMNGFALRFSSDRLPDEVARSPRYALFETESREVYIERDRRDIDWAWLWGAVGPWALWMLLALLLLGLLLALRQTLRDKRLSLLAKCLLGSALVHLVILFLLSLWGVTTSIGELLRKPGGNRVHLVADSRSDSLRSQLRAGLTEVSVATPTAVPLERPMEVMARPVAEMPLERPAKAATPGVILTVRAAEAAVLQEAPEVAALEPARPARPADVPAPVAPQAVRTSEQMARVQIEGAAEPASRPLDMPSRVEIPEVVASRADMSPTPAVEPTAADAMLAESDIATAPVLSPSEAEPSASVRMPAHSRQDEPALKEATPALVLPDTAAPAPDAPVMHAPAPMDLVAPDIGDVEHAAAEIAAVPEARERAMEMTPEAPSMTVAALPELSAVPGLALPAARHAQAASAAGGAADRELAAAAPAPITPPAMLGASRVLSPAVSEVAVPAAEPLAASVSVRPPEAGVDGGTSEMVLDLPSPVAAELPITGDGGIDIRMPAETPASVPAYAQRAPEVRQDLVERYGGDPETERAVAAALEWLAAHQSEDGRWSSRGFDEGCEACGGKPTIDSDVATTALSLMCFLGADHTHVKEGPYRDRVRRGLAWLIAQQSEDGDLRKGESLYSQGIATIALAEAYGMTRDPELAGPVERAVRFIAAARSRAGGWRYEPGQAGDTSVLGWQVMALTSARRAGVEVPQEAFDAAGAWLDGVSRGTPGLYSYQPGMPPTPTMTAEGLFCRQLLGHGRDEPIMRTSVEMVGRNPPEWGRRSTTYYWYYATLAMFQHGGEDWRRWNEAVKRELLEHQRDDGAAAGSWDPVDRWAGVGGRVYQTAICTLSLEVYYRYLPLYGGPLADRTHARP